MNLNPLQFGLTPIQADTSFAKNPYTTYDAVNNVDAYNRLNDIDDRLTSIASAPDDIANFGWNVPQGADVLKSYRNGTNAGTFTPVVGDGDFLTPSQLSHYADDVLTGRTDDYLGLQRGTAYGNDEGDTESAYYRVEKDRREMQYLQQLLSAARQNNLYTSQYPSRQTTDTMGYAPTGEEVTNLLNRSDPVTRSNQLVNLANTFSNYLKNTEKTNI